LYNEIAAWRNGYQGRRLVTKYGGFMLSRIRFAILALTLVAIAAIPAQAIQRVASKFGILEVRFGYAMPLGEYDGLPGMDFIFDDTVAFSPDPIVVSKSVALDADRVFNDGFAAGLSYGQMIGGHWRALVAFDYARNKVKNPIIQQIGDSVYTISFTDDLTYNQYDLAFRASYAFADLRKYGWSPFLGLGALAGLSTSQSPGYQTDSEFDFGMSLDCGLDVKLWEAQNGHSFATLSSINSWNFFATGERVSHLQIGGGIKYFFKP
jgi:hypothetical protein